MKSIDEDDDEEDGQGIAIKLQKLPDFDTDEVTSDKENEFASSNHQEKKKSLTNGNNEANLPEVCRSKWFYSFIFKLSSFIIWNQ